jgi:hypothetical protein
VAHEMGSRQPSPYRPGLPTVCRVEFRARLPRTRAVCKYPIMAEVTPHRLHHVTARSLPPASGQANTEPVIQGIQNYSGESIWFSLASTRLTVEVHKQGKCSL